MVGMALGEDKDSETSACHYSQICYLLPLRSLSYIQHHETNNRTQSDQINRVHMFQLKQSSQNPSPSKPNREENPYIGGQMASNPQIHFPPDIEIKTLDSIIATRKTHTSFVVMRRSGERAPGRG